MDLHPQSGQLDSIEEHPEEGTNTEGTTTIMFENLKCRKNIRIMTEMERKRLLETPKTPKDKDDTALLIFRNQRPPSPPHNSI